MTPELKLLKSHVLPDFPSGSSINYHQGKLYLVGDDAKNILILDKDYQPIDFKNLIDFPGKRIPKPVKLDLESSTFITLHSLEYFLILGSASTPNREMVILIPHSGSSLDMTQSQTVNDKRFMDQLKSKGLAEINIEGVTIIHHQLILANRCNLKNPTNHLVVTDLDFWKDDASVKISVSPIQLPEINSIPLGVSELCYEPLTDTLFMTLTSESTNNAYDDGAIGDSYLAWIKNSKSKIHNQPVLVDHIVNLSQVHVGFKNQKMEGLCVESIENQVFILHLVSDNDGGESVLFKLRLTL
jgi:hypothetical protein